MFEKNSKFPRFIIIMLIPIALTMLIGMFFGTRLVDYCYFIALLIAIVFLMLDRHYGENLTNYRLAFFVFDFINLIAAIAIIYYEYNKNSMLLNVLLVMFILIMVFLHVIDGLLLKNKDISKKHSVFVNLINIGAMICILTYFYDVSDLFFVIDALIFEIANIVIKLMLVYGNKTEKVEKLNEFDLVSIIRSQEEGDLD